MMNLIPIRARVQRLRSDHSHWLRPNILLLSKHFEVMMFLHALSCAVFLW